MKYNLHTHSFRCNHATGTDRAYWVRPYVAKENLR